ncbi:hypothetical protein V8C43DRAFT_210043 [Trichoderma afarasin]
MGTYILRTHALVISSLLCPLTPSKIFPLFQPTTAYHFRGTESTSFQGNPKPEQHLSTCSVPWGIVAFPEPEKKRKKKTLCSPSLWSFDTP